jgi:uncharacterized protein
MTDWPFWERQYCLFIEREAAGSDAAHGIEHVRRVVANARVLAAAERAALEVVLPAAWLHDCVTVPKDSPLRPRASRMAAEAAGVFLRAAGYPEQHIPAIEHAIEAHSFTAQIAPRTLEARVVQDADRLDSLGAVGIARVLMLGGAMGKPLYDPREPFPAARPPDDASFVIDHFYRKLLKLADTMQTSMGRAEAQARTAFMHNYLRQLGREIRTIETAPQPGHSQS